MFKYNRHNQIDLNRPMSSDKKTIRQTLIPSLLKTYEYNKSRNVKDVMIYEIANTYFDISLYFIGFIVFSTILDKLISRT